MQQDSQALNGHVALHRHLADSYRGISASGAGRVAHTRDIKNRNATEIAEELSAAAGIVNLDNDGPKRQVLSAHRAEAIEQHQSNATYNAQPRTVEPRNVILDGCGTAGCRSDGA